VDPNATRAVLISYAGSVGLSGLAGRLPWTPWDARQLGRAATAAALALGVAWLVTAATDEGGVAWGARAGRTLPLTPICAAVGAWVALAPVRSRGEALALAAMGRSPAQIAAAAVAGGALVALVAAVVLGIVRAVDVSGFFPTVTRTQAWSWTGAEFVDAARGLSVGIDGAPVRLAALAADAGRAEAGVPAFGRAAAALETAVAGVALPLLLAHGLLARVRATPLVLAGAGAIAGSVVLFQAAAARQAPAALAVLPPLALLAFAIRRYRS
jgi:hypothetical protein